MKYSVLALTLVAITAACEPAAIRPAEIAASTKIVAPAESVPAEYAAFSGLWTGSWGGCLDGKLAVQTIDAGGKATVVYAWGDHCKGRFKRGTTSVNGQINNGVLSLERFRNNAKVTYTLRDDGALGGAYDLNGDVSRGIFTKS